MSANAITLHVDAAAAVRAGSAVAGPVTLRLTAEDLGTLDDRQRETLARHLERAEGYGESLTRGAPPIGRADVPTLATLLDLRADMVASGLTAEQVQNMKEYAVDNQRRERTDPITPKEPSQ